VEALRTTGKAEIPALITRWLDTLDETGRWALLKLITGGLRIGVSARLAKTAVAGLGDLKPDDIEEVWHGLKPPYASLFAWAQGTGERPENDDPAPFAPAMLAHPIEDSDFEKLDAADFSPNGNGMASGFRRPRAPARMARSPGGFIRAPATTSPAPSPILSRLCPMMPRSTANCWC
jgi:hypothetical protein